MITEDEWFDLICDSYKSPPRSFEGNELPAFPPDQLQINTTGQAGPETLWEASIFYQDCSRTFRELGKPMQRGNKLLDFGVGWGRIARFFLRELPLSNIHGLDVMGEFVNVCRETFKSDNFHLTNPFPPSPMADNSFDYVVGYSVFSHLSERACKEWMEEFFRITTPGGLVALTTRGRPFFDYCESQKGKGPGTYADALSKMFPDFNEARARYDRGEFVHSNAVGVTGGGAMNSQFYGETFIPEPYAKAAYSDMFTLERFLFDPSRQTHPIMFFRKK